MEFLIGKIKLIYSLFLKITTGILIAASSYITIFNHGHTEVDSRIMWAILLLSLICSVIGAIFPSDGIIISKKSIIIRQSIHFILVNVAVMAFAFYLEWVPMGNWRMTLVMEGCILIVYIFVTVASYLSGYRTAERINQKLKERE